METPTHEMNPIPIAAELTGYIWWAPLITITVVVIAGYLITRQILKRRNQKK
jgi:hypothetical protein